MKKLLISIITAGSLVSCANVADTAQKSSSVDEQLLRSFHWQLLESKNKVGNDIDALINLKKNPIPINLDFKNKRLSINAGCNNMNSSYKLDKNIFQASQFSTTLKACTPELMNRDDAIVKFMSNEVLQLSNIGTVESPRLTMQDSKGNLLVWQGRPTGETRYKTKPETIFLEIKAKTRPCHGIIPQQCLVVREIKFDKNGVKSQAGEWGNFYSNIEGYKHDNNHEQTLRINRYKINKPAADQSQYAYELDMVIGSKVVKK